MGNRNARTLVFIVIVFRVVYTSQSTSISSIVRLKCNGLNAGYQKCIGTYILPNTLITTSVCAEACQYAENSPIIQRFIHEHYKNYVAVNGVFLRNDIALLVTTATKRQLVQMSALDHVSPLGQKAFVPIMDEDRPKLQVAIIQRCIENHNGRKGYYVCTNNKMSREMVKMCTDKSEQGTPLLLDDKIYGIMSLRSKDSCNIPQMRFTAIEPALSWISSTAEKLEKHLSKQIIRSSLDSNTAENNPEEYPDFKAFNVSSEEIDQNETLYSYSEEANNINEMEQLLAYFITKKPLDPIQHKLNELRQIGQDVHILRGGNGNLFSTVSSSRKPTVAPLRPFAATAIKFKPRLRTRVRSSTKDAQMFSTESFINKTTHVIPFIMDLGNNKTTNIMDWFHNEMKQMDDRPHFFILSTSTTTTPKPVFEDLT